MIRWLREWLRRPRYVVGVRTGPQIVMVETETHPEEFPAPGAVMYYDAATKRTYHFCNGEWYAA